MACALTPTCRGTAERHPQEWSRRVEGTDTGVPPPQPPASVACRVRKRETPFTLALARYLGLVLRARKRPMLGPRRDPNPQPPGNVSPRPETESHRPASQSCVIGSECCSTGMEPVSHGQTNRSRTVLLQGPSSGRMACATPRSLRRKRGLAEV